MRKVKPFLVKPTKASVLKFQRLLNQAQKQQAKTNKELTKMAINM